jgi:acetyl esterase/lipase
MSCAHPGWLLRFGLFAVALLFVPACRLTDISLWRPVELPPGEACAVDAKHDLPYCDDPKPDERHQLDLYLPRGRRDYPVVVLVHGGAWMVGDKRCCGLYSSVAEFLAGQGIGVAVPNYRLSPQVRHPEHVRDVARAFAWVHAHIAEYGGRPDRMFLMGHSAGGHLVALLATDEAYLHEVGLRSGVVRGVIASSGVYHIPVGDVQVSWGGAGPLAFRFDELAPLRGGGWAWSYPPGLPGIPLTVNVYGPVFGESPTVREDASPITHVHPGVPPFLLLGASRDLPTLPGMAEEFEEALRANECSVRLVRVPNRNHNSTFFRAIKPDDPAAKVMLEFIRGECAR